MKLKSETVGFVRGGMLFLEPPARWRTWQRDIWSCCRRFETPQICATHQLPLLRTSQSPIGARSIWTCAACTAEVLDRLAAEPGTITIICR